MITKTIWLTQKIHQTELETHCERFNNDADFCLFIWQAEKATWTPKRAYSLKPFQMQPKKKIEKERMPQEKNHTPQKSNLWVKTRPIKKYFPPP